MGWRSKREMPSTESKRPAAAGSAAPDELAQQERTDEITHAFLGLKRKLHYELIGKIDLGAMGSMTEEDVRVEVRRKAETLCKTSPVLLTQTDRKRLVEEILDEAFGYGPIEGLMNDPDVSDILINGPRQTYIERRGKLTKSSVAFHDSQHLLHVVQRMAANVGRRIDEDSPMIDARLPDGSRLNAIIRPVALNGPLVSIRRFGTVPLKIENLLVYGSITQEMLDFLQACIRARVNVIISGGTGSGKTTLLNALSAYIPEDERLVTIEDAAELQLQQPHVAQMETRPPNLEGRGEITTRDLVRNALRMRPDRIIVGECRGSEALDMLQAMNTGHEGSMTIIHANTPRDALSRLEMMVGMAGAAAPILWVQTLRAMRMKKMLSQLPDAFDMMSRTMRAGQTFMQAMQSVAEEGSPPLATEFAYCYDQQYLGMSVEAALRDLARRTGLLELRIFVLAVLVHRQTGGNLSELLDKLSRVICERYRVAGVISSLTAEGRVQAYVLLALPPMLIPGHVRDQRQRDGREFAVPRSTGPAAERRFDFNSSSDVTADRTTVDLCRDGGVGHVWVSGQWSVVSGGGTASNHGPRPAAGYDLLTVVLHEMGHILGLPDLDAHDHPDDLMAGHLSPGARRGFGTPDLTPARAAFSLPSLADRETVLPSAERIKSGKSAIGDRQMLVDRVLSEAFREDRPVGRDVWKREEEEEFQTLHFRDFDEQHEELDEFFARL